MRDQEWRFQATGRSPDGETHTVAFVVDAPSRQEAYRKAGRALVARWRREFGLPVRLDGVWIRGENISPYAIVNLDSPSGQIIAPDEPEAPADHDGLATVGEPDQGGTTSDDTPAV